MENSLAAILRRQTSQCGVFSCSCDVSQLSSQRVSRVGSRDRTGSPVRSPCLCSKTGGWLRAGVSSLWSMGRAVATRLVSPGAAGLSVSDNIASRRARNYKRKHPICQEKSSAERAQDGVMAANPKSSQSFRGDGRGTYRWSQVSPRLRLQPAGLVSPVQPAGAFCHRHGAARQART